MNMEMGKAEEIAENLRTKIINGTLPVGSKLASERDLANELHVSRMTVRKAIEIIESQGLVARYTGKGTFILGTRERILVDKGREISSITESELRRSGSFLKDMERLGRKPQVQFLEQPSLIAADSEIASHLQIKEGALVLKRYRLQLADALPYRLIESFYPSDLFGELLTTDIGDKPLFAWLQERHGLRVTRAKEILVARLPTQHEYQLLRIATNAPVVAVDRTVWANSTRPVEWAHIIAVAALYAFTYEYDIPAWNEETQQNDGTLSDQSTNTSHP